MIEVTMILRLEDELRSGQLPAGYSLRWFRAGDRDTWQRIQTSTGIYDPVAPDLFEREFGPRAELLPERQCFVEDASGVAVGTSTAWLPDPERPQGQGRLHWVAVSPEHQRRGIGSFLTVTSCNRLRDLGAESAYLTTGSENVAAIRLYLSLGFRPEAADEAELRAWQSLVAVVGPSFESRLRGSLSN
jgi:ribosomal protein S18 acetylase RimI-like enzyme